SAPAGDGGVGLHRVVMVAAGPVRHLQPDLGGSQGRVGVAPGVGGGVVGGGRGEVGRGLLGVIADLDPAGGVLCRLEAGGDHDGDRLTEEPDAVVLEGGQPLARRVVRPRVVAVRQPGGVAVADHPEHAGLGDGVFGVDAGDAAAADGAVDDDGVDDPVDVVIG